jgi:molecular chaperone DnaJ
VASRRDYYEVLGVERTSSVDEIKSSYRKLALQYHPDRNPGDAESEDKFKEATEAYEVLRNDETRQRYDQFGHAGVGSGGGSDFAGFDVSDALRAFMRDFGFGGIGDIFGDAMGGQPSGRGGRRGRDLQVKVRLELEEISKGLEKSIRVKHQIICETCSGSGAASGGRTRCSQCEGHGQVRQVRQSLFGQFMSVAACSRCDGSGEMIESPCLNCKGSGTLPDVTTVKVQIPAGIHGDQFLRLAGQGDAGPNGGGAGDLLVLIEEKPHDLFTRDGDNLNFAFPIAFPVLALGGKIDVPTLDGSVQVEVLAGTQPDRTLRLRGKGLPRLEGGKRGDLYLRLKPFTVGKLSSREREILAELQELQKDKAPKPGKGFFDRVKEAFRG